MVLSRWLVKSEVGNWPCASVDRIRSPSKLDPANYSRNRRTMCRKTERGRRTDLELAADHEGDVGEELGQRIRELISLPRRLLRRGRHRRRFLQRRRPSWRGTWLGLVHLWTSVWRLTNSSLLGRTTQAQSQKASACLRAPTCQPCLKEKTCQPCLRNTIFRFLLS
jgi:hypothetical protein